ncbi:hypothetical protein ACPC3D_13610 [Streptomyces cellulosae]
MAAGADPYKNPYGNPYEIPYRNLSGHPDENWPTLTRRGAGRGP